MTLRYALLSIFLVGCTNAPRDPQDPFGGGFGPPDINDFPPFDAGIPTGPPPNFGTDVVSAQTPPPPLSGGTLLVLHDGNTAVASDPDRDQIYVVDLTQQKLLTTISLSPADEPGRLIEDAAGRVHAALRRGGAVVTFSPADPSSLIRRNVCPAPRGIAYDKTNDVIDVACAGGELVTLPSASGDATRTVQLERDLRDVAIVNGQLWVSTFKKAQILTVASDGSVSARTDLPGITDFNKNQFAATVAWRMVPIGTDRVLVSHQLATVGEVMPAPGGYGGGGDPCGGISRTGVALLTADGQIANTGVADAVLPADIAYSPNQGAIAVLAAGNSHTVALSQVMVMPLLTLPGVPDLGSDNMVPTCEFAMGMGVNGEVTALAYDGQDRLWVQTREPATLQLIDGVDVPVTVPLSNDSRADTGWAVFHSNSGAGLACASCHPEGGEDGHVWEFNGLGPRRTQSVRGKVTTTAPFHWSGDIPTTAALVSEVWQKRMAGPILDDGQITALFSWVDAIPLLPQSTPPDSAAVARGEALFTSKDVGCGTCHFGPELTNNQTTNVGTGGNFQVPRLLGVGWRAPFLHNGCAATLKDRFGKCGGADLHGVTSQLSDGDLNDLVAYLNTL